AKHSSHRIPDSQPSRSKSRTWLPAAIGAERARRAAGHGRSNPLCFKVYYHHAQVAIALPPALCSEFL
ncbi:unnamed protein product, partial [Urochloa humidicola]